MAAATDRHLSRVGFRRLDYDRKRLNRSGCGLEMMDQINTIPFKGYWYAYPNVAETYDAISMLTANMSAPNIPYRRWTPPSGPSEEAARGGGTSAAASWAYTEPF
jgi:hypothetical protein